LPIKTKIVSCHTADTKPIKQEINGTVILPPLVFPAHSFESGLHAKVRLSWYWPAMTSKKFADKGCDDDMSLDIFR
jgi:hypothetical protein